MKNAYAPLLTKNASVHAYEDVSVSLRVFHREKNERSSWGGPATTAGKGEKETSVVRAASHLDAIRLAGALSFVRLVGY